MLHSIVKGTQTDNQLSVIPSLQEDTQIKDSGQNREVWHIIAMGACTYGLLMLLLGSTYFYVS